MVGKVSYSTELFITALFVSILTHTTVITGVSFVLPEPSPRANVTMEVILVPSHTEQNKEHGDFLAQANQEGGGFSEGKQRPTAITPSPFPDIATEIVALPPPSEAAAKPKPAQVAQITTHKPSPHKVAAAVSQVETAPSVEQFGLGEQHINSPEVSALTLINNARASVASIQAEIDQKFNNYSKRPRQRFISASTREYKYAAYMDSWRQKIERIGTMNFPEEARRKNISGELTLDVALNKDGSIHSLKILKHSRHAVLDKAAVNIVRMSAPFAPFSRDIGAETDILHITRTWVFEYGSVSSY